MAKEQTVRESQPSDCSTAAADDDDDAMTTEEDSRQKLEDIREQLLRELQDARRDAGRPEDLRVMF